MSRCQGINISIYQYTNASLYQCISVAVYQYTDPKPEAQNVSFFLVRLGYASTFYKLQGAQLPHVTIYLDVPGNRAAAYLAMSRVKKDTDYLFGGHHHAKHFVPNV